MGFDAQRGVGAFERAVGRIEATFERPTDFTREPFVDWLAVTEREQFATQGAAGKGGRWQPRARSTLKRKAAGPRVLERTGAMRDMLTRPASLRGLVEVSGDRIIFRLPEPANFHQRGTTRMPAREVYAPSEGQKQDLKGRVKKAAGEEMRRRGFNVKG